MLYLVVGVAAVTWLLLWSTTSPPRLLGVYSRPGFWYWLKVAIFYIIVKVRRLVSVFPNFVYLVCMFLTLTVEFYIHSSENLLTIELLLSVYYGVLTGTNCSLH